MDGALIQLFPLPLWERVRERGGKSVVRKFYAIPLSPGPSPARGEGSLIITPPSSTGDESYINPPSPLTGYGDSIFSPRP